MRKILKKRATYSILFFVGVLCLLLVFLVPTTGVYKAAMHALWDNQQYTFVYYLNRDDAMLAMQEGNYYFDGGAYDLARAQKSYERAIALDPTIKLAHYQIARIYFVNGDQAKAKEYINDELALDPANQRSFYIRGLINDALGDLPSAEADFRRFVAWSPGEWGGYNDLSYVLAKEGKYTESEATVEIALTKVPDGAHNPWLLNSLGLAQLNELKYQEAATSFAKALALATTLTPAQWERAYSANDPQSVVGSLQTFQQSIQKNLSTAKMGDTIE